MSSTELPGARFGDWISEGWRMFTEQWKAWVLLALGYLGIMLLPSIGVFFAVFTAAFASSAAQAGPYGRTAAPVLPLFVMFVAMISVVIIIPLSAYFKGGMYKSAFKQLRGGQVEFRDLFSAGDRFLPLLGETILVALITFIGALFCIIPGLVAAGLLMFAGPLTVERRLGVIEAMRESYEMTKQNILIFTLFALILSLIVSAGTYLCYIGILVTYPLMFTMGAVAYRDCFGLSGARSFRGLNASAIPQYSTPTSYEPPQPHSEPMSPPAPPGATFYTYEPVAPESETTQPPILPDVPTTTEPPENPPEPQGTFCPGCQTQLPPTATFCFRCGTKVRT